MQRLSNQKISRKQNDLELGCPTWKHLERLGSSGWRRVEETPELYIIWVMRKIWGLGALIFFNALAMYYFLVKDISKKQMLKMWCRVGRALDRGSIVLFSALPWVILGLEQGVFLQVSIFLSIKLEQWHLRQEGGGKIRVTWRVFALPENILQKLWQLWWY